MQSLKTKSSRPKPFETETPKNGSRVGDERIVIFFSPSPVLSDKIDSDPVLIRRCKIMYFYSAS